MENQDISWLLKEKFGGVKSDAFYADCKSLALGKPLAYLIGWTPFLNCKIWLDSRPLIPRPETEFWTEKAIKVIRDTGLKIPRVLDLCSGSGCIGVAVAKSIPESSVDFSEIDVNHIPTINKNLTENGLDEKKSTVAHTSLFAKLHHQYDFVLSNPPYIDASLERADASVTENEPYVALFGGKDGMEIISQIIEQAPSHLNHHGQLWLEHEPEQTSAIYTLGREHGFSVTTHNDQYGVERYSILVLQ